MFAKSAIFVLPLVIIIFYSTLSAQERIHISATSTGQTTGEIGKITVTNTSDKEITVVLGPFLIPATGNYQGYIIPHKIEISVPPGTSVSAPLNGYCTDIARAPVPESEPLIEYDKWVEIPTPDVTQLPDPTRNPSEYIRDWHSRYADSPDLYSPAGGFQFHSDPTQLVSIYPLPHESPGEASGDCCLHPTLPGTDIIIPYRLDFDRHPKTAAPLIYEVIRDVENVYDSLDTAGEINTPFSGNPARQKDAVIQQTFWVFTSLLKGNDAYGKDNFKDKLAEQLETATGQELDEAPPAVKENFQEGVNNFWSTFELVGEKAKILKKGTIETTEPPIGTVKIKCPENGSFIYPEEPFLINWDVEYFSELPETVTPGSYSLRLVFTPDNNGSLINPEPLTIEEVETPGLYSLPQNTPVDVCYNVSATTSSSIILPPVAFNICLNDISLDSLIRLVDEMRKKVENAEAKLSENSLVQEARLIQMIRELSSSPEGIEELYDKWLNTAMDKLKEDLTKIDDVSKVIQVVEHIEKLLSILEKIDTNQGNLTKYKSIREKCEKLRENWLKPADDAQQKFNQFYDELISMLEDFKGHVQNKIEEFVTNKIQETIQKMLVSKYGPGPAGALMSAAEDLKNFIDALIKKGELDEAKVMFHLYYFEMLKRVYEHPK